jgi:serine/threonine protein phosphatase 1
MTLLNRLFGAFRAPPSPSAPHGPAGHRLYAIGDIHGRLDLLDRLLAEIEADIELRLQAKILIVFLGDLIDRGPQSAQVIERLRKWRPAGATKIFLLGNHEEVFLRVLAGEVGILHDWLRFGGAECLSSYGVSPAEIAKRSEVAALREIKAAVPAAHYDFLQEFADTFQFGDYLFVHAGIRPGSALAAQSKEDLRWIREPFLSDGSDHGFVVVHGHTISNQVDERPNRIGLDTGAYRTGILTAMAVEGGEHWFLDTSPDGFSIETAKDL